MKDLANLSKPDFEALVGQSVEVAGVSMDVESVIDGKAGDFGGRQSFSVFLLAADTASAPALSGPVSVKHEALGEHVLLVNRIVSRADEAVYQIVFN